MTQGGPVDFAFRRFPTPWENLPPPRERWDGDGELWNTKNTKGREKHKNTPHPSPLPKRTMSNTLSDSP